MTGGQDATPSPVHPRKQLTSLPANINPSSPARKPPNKNFTLRNKINLNLFA